MENFKSSKILLAGTIAAYCLIGIEIIIMISPFALYFYSVYAPVLQFFASSSYLSWTTEFFLPHMVFTHDPVIVGISYFQVLLIVGLLLFFSAAVPLYYGRFRKKGVVLFSFYAKIRHPQYLFLAISGFGLLIYWPRFIILIMYVTMLFVYYLLARNEERKDLQCLVFLDTPEVAWSSCDLLSDSYPFYLHCHGDTNLHRQQVADNVGRWDHFSFCLSSFGR